MTKKNRGSSLDDFLKEEGTFDQDQALAIKEVIVWQLIDAMHQRSLGKARLAVLLGTSRSQVDRLLDPSRDVMLSTLQRAAALVGRKVQVELV
jgi:antitoxin HicB